MKRHRLMIVDDHQMMIEGLLLLLVDEPDLQVVATAQRGRQALALLDDQEIDLLIVDMSMPEMPGYELVRLVRARLPEVKVLVLSMFDDKHMIRTALLAGADGYVLKGSGRKELLTAIRKIMDDDVYYSGEVAEKLLEDYAQISVPGQGASLQAQDLERLRQEKWPEEDERTLRLSEEEINQLYEQLLSYCKSDKPYLDRALTLPRLAEQLHAHPYKLSYVINYKEKRNFFHFINAFRVKEAQELLQSPATRFYTLEAIGFQAGFNNKVTFIASFKKECGLTPGQYKKRTLSVI